MALVTGTLNPDILTGTALADTVQGLGSDDVLYAFDGNDLLQGGDGDDILYAGSGNDTLDGGAGEDLFYGQSGIDTVTYLSSAAGLTLNLADTTLSTGDAAGDFFLSIEKFILGSYNDTFIGGTLGEDVRGGLGNDMLFGNGGIDRLLGEGGDDTLLGGSGADFLDGGTGFDIASYADMSNAITLDLVNSANTTGDAVGDSYTSIEALQLTAFNDTLILGTAIRNADGGAGNDAMTGSSANDTLLGGLGLDTLSGGTGIDSLDGGDGNDRLTGEAGNDILIGGAGDDTLEGGIGADTYVGGTGIDRVLFVGNTRVDLQNGAGNLGQALGDVFDSVDEFAFSFGISTFVGGTSAATVLGLSGVLNVIAGSGAEFVASQGGQVNVSYAATTTAITLALDSFGYHGTRGAEGDQLIIADGLTLTRSADVLDMSAMVSTIRLTHLSAGSGADTLKLKVSDASFIDAGGGNDRVTGTIGGGTLDLGLGDDQATVSVGSGFGSSFVAHGGDGRDRMTISSFFGFVTLNGDAGNDVILATEGGSATANLDGGSGNDSLVATGYSTLSLQGDTGDDTLIGDASQGGAAGGDGNDSLSFTAFVGGIEGGAGNDTLTFGLVRSGAGTAELLGGDGDDVLTVQSVVHGSFLAGNSAKLNGGAGDDVMNGTVKEGNIFEHFVFDLDWGNDTINGFDQFALGGGFLDVIEFHDTAAAGLDDVLDLVITGDATHTVLTFGSNSITLNGLPSGGIEPSIFFT